MYSRVLYKTSNKQTLYSVCVNMKLNFLLGNPGIWLNSRSQISYYNPKTLLTYYLWCEKRIAEILLDRGWSKPFVFNDYADKWWNDPYFYSLPADRLAYMDAIHRNYSRYDYCTDFVRNPVPPKECTLPRRWIHLSVVLKNSIKGTEDFENLFIIGFGLRSRECVSKEWTSFII